jgi:hypothetical protein
LCCIDFGNNASPPRQHQRSAVHPPGPRQPNRQYHQRRGCQSWRELHDNDGGIRRLRNRAHFKHHAKRGNQPSWLPLCLTRMHVVAICETRARG